MNAPKVIVDAVAMLRTERLPVAARLDAIDLALDNLGRVFDLSEAVSALPARGRTRRATKKGGGSDRDAANRRDVLLAAITRSDVGMTLAELRKTTPKMDGKDRSNALQTLKIAGTIRRVGNVWRAA